MLKNIRLLTTIIAMIAFAFIGNGRCAYAEEQFAEQDLIQQGEQSVSQTGERATEEDVTAANSNNKKGIQGTEYRNGSYADPAYMELGVNHVLFNLDLKDIINTDGTGQPYTYNGKTYYFNYSNNLIYYEWRARELREEGVTVTFVILMGWSDNPQLQKLIYPDARVSGHYYYALNIKEEAAREQLAATFHYLADIFGSKDSFVQNWIIGNEVNMPEEYNYTGTADIKTNVDICVQTYELLYNALQSKSPYAKAYISLTHHWNTDDGGKGISTKNFIDQFAGKIGNRNWNIAFHAYPPNMQEYLWSEKSAGWLSHDESSRYVCGANLEVLTDYIKNRYGTSHRIILSEQGFDANSGEKEQAASLVYTYYAAARNDMVDAVIFVNWQDSNQSSHSGYALGFLDGKGRKREAYAAFKYMDTSQSAAYTDRYKSILGIRDWTDNIIMQAKNPDAKITGTSIYIPPLTEPDRVICALGVETDKETELEYRWLIYDIEADQWSMAQDWTRTDNYCLVWYPPKDGRYLIHGEVRTAAGNSTGSATAGYIHDSRHAVYDDVQIIGKCQMPYWEEGGGYLIGVETNKNPNQKLQYELLIMDCTLYAEGKPAWIWSSGRQTVSEGNACWVVWQPQYGYYLTYFRVYDEDGNLIDDECYGFANAY